MGKSIKQCRYQYVIALVLCLVYMLGTSVAKAQAKDIPASTFKPFVHEQTVSINGSEKDRWIYPTGSEYIMISYGQGTKSVDRDIIATKLDKEGKAIWTQVYNLPGVDTLSLIHFQGSAFVIAVNSQDKQKHTTRLLQLASNGNVIWQRELPLNKVDTIASTNDNGLVIGGTSGADNLDIHLIKVDKNGNWKSAGKVAGKWEKVYKNAGNQQASQICQVLDKDDYNDGYVLTGYTDSNTNGKKDVYVIRLDAYGEVLWSKNYGGKYDDQGITIVGAVDQDDELIGFFIAGNSESRGGDQDLYLIYISKYGTLQNIPGYEYYVDNVKERRFGGAHDQLVMELVAVPDGFKEDRKLYGEDIEGQGGAVLVGYLPEDQSVLLVRINERGHMLWQRSLPIPGVDLIMGTIVKGDNHKQNLAYSVVYPDPVGNTMEVYTLQVFLEGVLKQDKAIPQNDQIETNGEAVKWKKQTLKYEAMRDISKELKDLLMLQQPVPLTAVSTAKGEIDWPDSSYYLGNLVIGKADGEGTLLFPDGVWYKGAWKNNMFNGKGCLRFPSGENYEGEFKDHMMYGQGVFKWPTGEFYRGAFQYNMREGAGIFTWPGGIVYEGNFVKDDAEGQGIIRWPNGERYEGQMQKGNATGQGSYYFPSGEWYRGELINMKFDGVGVYHWPNSAYYVGEFKQDRLYGEGYYVWPNGVQQWGYWKDDRYLGINKELLDSKGKW